MKQHPPIPYNVKEFQHHYGYEEPVTIHRWEWSTTFSRWSALVTFKDGWHGFSYPKLTKID